MLEANSNLFLKSLYNFLSFSIAITSLLYLRRVSVISPVPAPISKTTSFVEILDPLIRDSTNSLFLTKFCENLISLIMIQEIDSKYLRKFFHHAFQICLQKILANYLYTNLLKNWLKYDK